MKGLHNFTSRGHQRRSDKIHPDIVDTPLVFDQRSHPPSPRLGGKKKGVRVREESGTSVSFSSDSRS